MALLSEAFARTDFTASLRSASAVLYQPQARVVSTTVAERMLEPMRETAQRVALVSAERALQPVVAKTILEIFHQALSFRKAMSRLWSALAVRRKDEDPHAFSEQDLLFDETAASAVAALATGRHRYLVVFWRSPDYLLSTRMPCGPCAQRTSLLLPIRGAALT